MDRLPAAHTSCLDRGALPQGDLILGCGWTRMALSHVDSGAGMLSDEVVAHLESAALGFVGTRDESLRPTVHALVGWTLDSERGRLTCFVQEGHTAGLEGLESIPEVSVTIVGSTRGFESGDMQTAALAWHDCFQLKGVYVASRAIDEDDVVAAKRIRDRGVMALTTFGQTEPFARGMYGSPGRAIEVEIREVFVQTPGPRAGQRIFPKDER